jgi:hypothetical protein
MRRAVREVTEVQRQSPECHCFARWPDEQWSERTPPERHLTISRERRAERGKKALLEEARTNEVQQEAAKIRRLQIMISMVMSVIGQDPNLTIEEASELVAGTKRAALAMFPDKEFAYDILYKPRLQRLMRERFRLQ